MPSPPKYLTERDVAALTGFSRYTFQRLRFEHRGPAYLKVGRSVRYRLEDVLAWMESRRIQVDPDRNL